MELERYLPLCCVACAALLGALLYAAVVVPWRRNQAREVEARQEARRRARMEAAAGDAGAKPAERDDASGRDAGRDEPRG